VDGGEGLADSWIEFLIQQAESDAAQNEKHAKSPGPSPDVSQTTDQSGLPRSVSKAEPLTGGSREQEGLTIPLVGAAEP
jgi:hypothetical protein